ncbi:MAG TPA: hypothetical protein VG602_07870 [Actinomycetota bacterium]|nr:hypothetical protein [Actinomycetota bacterium]
MIVRAATVLLVAGTLAAACGGEPAPGRIDVSGPLENLPPCDLPDRGRKPIEGLIVPEGAVIKRVVTRGPTQNVRGFIPLTPVQIRRYYEERSDLEILAIEDEIYEAEALVSAAGFRTFIKAEAVCDRGSRFIAVVASELAAGQVPTPAGGVTPGS